MLLIPTLTRIKEATIATTVSSFDSFRSEEELVRGIFQLFIVHIICKRLPV